MVRLVNAAPGPNALRALDGLGVLEAVLSRSDETTPTKRPFRFLAGVGAHEHVYDVGCCDSVSAAKSKSGSSTPSLMMIWD